MCKVRAMQSYSSSSFAFVYLVSDAVFDADHEYGVIFLFPFGFKGENPGILAGGEKTMITSPKEKLIGHELGSRSMFKLTLYSDSSCKIDPRPISWSTFGH
jgi:hypothetical protein